MNGRITRYLALILLLLSRFHATGEVPFLDREYEPSKWPEVHLKLSQAGTLKDVFDSGLRPYRHPGLETSLLEVKHLRLIVHLASEKMLPEIKTEWMNITMFNDGEIANLEGSTPKLSLEEARTEMLKWLPYGTRSQADLDAYLKAVETDFLDFDDPYRGVPDGYAVGWKEPGWKQRGGGARISVWFRKSVSQTHPLNLYFKLSWDSNRPSKDAKIYRVPIPPPPGYENVSMDAPKNFGPDSAVNILRAQDVDIGESLGAKRAYENSIKEAQMDRPEKRRSLAAKDPSDSKKSTIFPWWLVACPLALLFLALAGWLKTRKSKSASSSSKGVTRTSKH